MTDPLEIYLQPECCADPDTGRLWCEDNAPVDCEDGKPWTKYIRADAALQREHTLAEVVAFLNGSAPLDGVWFGDKHPERQGMFWWRSLLKAALAQRTEQTGPLRFEAWWQRQNYTAPVEGYRHAWNAAIASAQRTKLQEHRDGGSNKEMTNDRVQLDQQRQQWRD